MVYSSTFPKGAAELRIYVDGKLAVGGNITLGNSVPSATPARVVLAEGLAAGSSHNITGVYITDPITLSWDTLPAGFAQTAHSFTTDGAIAPQPPIVAGAQRRFDIYGDSITAGNQINPATCQPDWAVRARAHAVCTRAPTPPRARNGGVREDDASWCC